MASKNVVLKGTTYSGIEEIQLPVSGGGTATFTEVSDTTATTDTVIDGEVFYTSAGVRSVGTAVIPTKLSDLTNDLSVSDFTNDAGYLTTETDPNISSWARAASKPSYTASEVGAVPTTRTVNSKALSANITLSASDVGAVPTTRTVNGKALSSNISLSASDVGALADSTSIPSKTSDLTNDSGFITSYTETDPVFAASAAHGITAADIAAWNGKSDFSGSYNDLTNKPTIPTVNNATLTIQKNGTNVQTFTANASSNKTANITVPTAVSELTNDSGFITASAIPTEVSSFENDAGYLTSYTETDPTVPSWAKQTSKPSYTASEVGAVPTTRTVNSKALSSNITLSASDVGAVPTTRTVNGKALSSNITLSASDVSALPSSTSIPSALTDLTNDMTVSDFTNDAGYLTAHQDISGKMDIDDPLIDIDSTATSGIDKSLYDLLVAYGWWTYVQA